MPYFDALKICCRRNVENIVRKEKLLVTSNFSFLSQCFLPCIVLIFYFKWTLKCRLLFLSIWTSLKFCCLVVLGFYATLTAKVISGRSVTHMCFLEFLTPVLTTFLSKATDYFSHRLLQR